MCVILHMARSPHHAQLLRIICSDKLDRRRVSLDSVDTFNLRLMFRMIVTNVISLL